MIAFWEHDDQLVDNVKICLGGDLAAVDSAVNATRSVTGDVGVDLLVVGPSADLGSALRVAEEVQVQRPEVGVVLMRRRLDVALLSEASRAGVRQVVAADDLAALADACRRSRQLSARLGAVTGEVSEGRAVTVFSAKGGCGKTTVAANVAAVLAGECRVLLVDLDLAFGDVAITLGVRGERSLVDLLPMAGKVDRDALGSIVTVDSRGLDIIAACALPSDADLVPATLVSEVVRVAKSTYDVVLLDTPPAFNEHVLAAFDASDLTLVVAGLDIPSVKNLRLTLETMDLLGLPEELRTVVVNRIGASSGLSVRDVSDAIHRTVDAEIPENRDVSTCLNRGVPVVLHAPKNPASVALRSLATTHVRPGASGRPTATPPVADDEPVAAERRAKELPKRAGQRAARSPFRRRLVAARAEA